MFDMTARFRWTSLLFVLLPVVAFWAGLSSADDWPQFGRDQTRNAVSPETDPPMNWSVGEFDHATKQWKGSRNIKWTAPLGSETFGDPVVVDGQVWVGTNNSGTVDASVLAGFDTRDGKSLYQYISPRLPQGRVHDGPYSPIACSPLIEGERMWFTTNRCETVCLDLGPLKRGEGQPRELWKVDMMKQFGVFPHRASMMWFHSCSIASYQDRIYVITGNGVNESYSVVPAPDAPSLICFNKENGDLLWQDNSPGANILQGQWSSPLVVETPERVQVVVPQGDGWLRSFDALTGKLIWKFDINFKVSKWSLFGATTRNDILATPVLYGGRIYVASGLNVSDWGDGQGRLVCIDPTKTGDISSELAIDAEGQPLPANRIQAVNPEKGQRAVVNPNSGLIWEYVNSDRNANGQIEFEEAMHRANGNVAIKDDLLVLGDLSGLVHCLNATTGKVHWTYDCMAVIYASPLIVEDKVYVADEEGRVRIFRLSAEPHEPLAEISMDTAIHTAPIFANGTLYIAGRSTLFAIAADNQAKPKPASTGGYWPQWRGPNRDNLSTESGLLKQWPEGGPSLKWRVEGLGEGIASVSIADERIFTVGYQDQSEFVVALDEETGRLSWATRIGPAINESPLMRWLAQRSPTVDGERLYSITADGVLVCLSTANGRELWRKNYATDFGAKRPSFGFCDYPLVDGDKLICSPGSAQATVVALDKKTGNVLWKTAAPVGDETRGNYSAMMLAEVNGLRQYVAYPSNLLIGIAAEDGRLLWTHDKVAQGLSNSLTPIVQGDRVFCTSGIGTEVIQLKLTRDGDKIAVEELYRQPFRIDRFQDGTVLVGEHVYSYDQRGWPLCLAWNTGAAAWKSERSLGFGKATVIYADGCLYFRRVDGQMTLARATPAGFTRLGEFTIPDHSKALGATMPVIAGGRLYLRDDQRLLCYDVRESAVTGPKAEVQTIKLDIPKAAALATFGEASDGTKARTLRSVFVPTPQDVVDKMLELAKVKQTDVVYDLGSGDGRIVITAAKKYGCLAVGYEIDKELVELSRAKAEAASVESLATIERKDLFTVDLSSADVIAVYLLPKQLEKLVPQLEKLKPGARIVSHYFEIPGYVPAQSLDMDSREDGDRHRLHLYVTPLTKAAIALPVKD